MNQAVPIDVEVLQRIKFLMEYDVMKTSSENFLVEQQRIRGTSTSTVSDYMPFGKKFSPTSSEDTWWLNVAKADRSKTGTIDHPRTSIYRQWERPPKEVRDMKLDDLTLKVREIMSDWRTGTIEAVGAALGVGIPVIFGANGLWVTLEVAQLLKGTPSWLDLIISVFAISTLGAGPTVLKSLFNRTKTYLGGKGKNLKEVLDAMYEAAKDLGLWNKLKPILSAASKGINIIIDVVKKTWKWLNDNVFWIFEGVTWLGKVSINGFITALTRISNIIDTWLAYIGTKAGLKPELASKLGPAARAAGVMGGTGYALARTAGQSGSTVSPSSQTITPSVLKKQDTSDWDY